MFHQVAAFKTHLTEIHKIEDADAVDAKASVRRIGPNSQAHFWCGFCKEVVNLEQKGVDAWTERFNHIDDHFMGRSGLEKRSILSWVHADGEENEGVQVSPKEYCDDSPSSSSSSSESPPKSDSSSNNPATAKLKRDRDNDDKSDQHAKKQKYEKTVDCVS